MNTTMWLVIAGMMAVTYLPRMLPLVLYSRRTPRPWQRRILSLVPFAAIGALILPDGLTSVDGAILPSVIGLAVAGGVAVFVRKPIVVVVSAVIAVLVVMWVAPGAA